MTTNQWRLFAIAIGDLLFWTMLFINLSWTVFGIAMILGTILNALRLWTSVKDVPMQLAVLGVESFFGSRKS